jgi:hypothetical protein
LPDVDAVRDEGDDSHLPATEGAQHALPLHASDQRGGNQFCGLQRQRFVLPIDAHPRRRGVAYEEQAQRLGIWSMDAAGALARRFRQAQGGFA